MSKKKTLYYIFIITVLAAVLIFYFMSFPLIKKIDNTKKNLQDKHAELKQLEKKENELKELENDYKNFQDKIDIITKMFPKSKDVSDYMTQIENAALSSEVAIKSIKVSAQTQNTKEQPQPQYTQLTKNGDIYELPFDISVTSSNFENIVNFIGVTEKLSRFTSINKLNIKPAENNNLEASISLIIYVLP